MCMYMHGFVSLCVIICVSVLFLNICVFVCLSVCV